MVSHLGQRGRKSNRTPCSHQRRNKPPYCSPKHWRLNHPRTARLRRPRRMVWMVTSRGSDSIHPKPNPGRLQDGSSSGQGLNNVAYHILKPSGQAWNSTWDDGGFSTVDQPAFLTEGSIGVAVVRGTDDGIYYNIFSINGGQSKGWTSLAGATSTTPELAGF